MKTNLPRTASLVAIALLTLSFAPGVSAGPGAQYWATSNKSSPSVEAPKAVAHTPCVGSEDVVVTAMKPAWQNGRGPLTHVPIGTEHVCRACSAAKLATTTVTANGFAPVMMAETSAAGAMHRCTSACTAKNVN